MTSRMWPIALVGAVLLALSSLLFKDGGFVFWSGVAALIYLVLLKIEPKAARLLLCFYGAFAGVFLMGAFADLLIKQFVPGGSERMDLFLLAMLPLSVFGFGVGFVVTARMSDFGHLR
jgi:hypothetical protein